MVVPAIEGRSDWVDGKPFSGDFERENRTTQCSGDIQVEQVRLSLIKCFAVLLKI